MQRFVVLFSLQTFERKPIKKLINNLLQSVLNFSRLKSFNVYAISERKTKQVYQVKVY